jgi:thiamine phosphate synthase YjbQ (UPF0047 family)
VTSIEIPLSVATALPTLVVFDVTNEVSHELRRNAVVDGIAYVSPNACSSFVRVTERESGFFCDIEALLARLLPHGVGERERLLLGLLGARTEQIPFMQRRLCLGQWQRVLLFCIDGESRADFTLTLLG